MMRFSTGTMFINHQMSICGNMNVSNKKTFARKLIEALVSHVFETVSFQLQSCDSVFSFE